MALGLVILLVLLGLLVANHQASAYRKHLASWHQSQQTMAKKLALNTFSNQIFTDNGVETDAQLAKERQTCNTEYRYQKQVAADTLPSLGFNPVGFLSAGYRRQQSARAHSSASLAKIDSQLNANLAAYHTFCTFYTAQILQVQIADAAQKDEQQYLTFSGVTDNNPSETCADAGGCLPDNNLDVWPKIAADDAKSVGAVQAYATYLRQHGCFFPGAAFRQICNTEKEEYGVLITDNKKIDDAMRNKDIQATNAAYTAHDTASDKYDKELQNLYAKVNPGVDTNGNYEKLTFKQHMQTIEAAITQAARQRSKA